MAKSAVLTNYSDSRKIDPSGKPVWEAKATFIWQTGDGFAAQTVTLANFNGLIRSMVVTVSNPTAELTVTASLIDVNLATLATFATLAKNSINYKDEGDFNEIPITGNLAITVIPTADPGGSGQTLTVVVVIRGV